MSTTLAALKAEKAKLDAEIEKLTKEELVRHKQDKSGVLEVVVRSSCNVQDADGCRYTVGLLPYTTNGAAEVEVSSRENRAGEW